MKHKIVIIEDHFETAQLMSDYFVNYGFEVKVSQNAMDGLTFIHENHCDIVILDINLPDFNGFEVCATLRKHSSVPIIFVTADSDKNSHLLAFQMGADDFLVKPINLEILLAHIWAMLKRIHVIPIVENNKESLEFDSKNNKFIFNANPLSLTAIELGVLKILIKNKGVVVSRDKLAIALSGDSKKRSIEYHIKNIRRKLGDSAKNPKFLKTEYGFGYKLLADL